MYRKLSIPVGVAMLAALALVGMLGIFAFNAAQPAQAAGIGSATVMADPATPMVTATYTITVMTNAALDETQRINITPPGTLDDGVVDNVTVNGDMASTTARNDAYNVNLPMAVTSGAMLTIVIPGVMNPAAGSHTWMVDSSLGNAAPVSATVMIGDTGDGMDGDGMDGGTMLPDTGAMVTALPEGPGDASQIKVTFMTMEELGSDDYIRIRVSDDLGLPRSIDESDVSIAHRSRGMNLVASPLSVVVEDVGGAADQYQITVLVGDMNPDDDVATPLPAGTTTVTFRQGAGITNRTEGGSDDWLVKTNKETDYLEIGEVYSVPWTITLSSNEDSRGEEITAIGKGFKNGTTTYFWRDSNRNGMIDTDADGVVETVLCDAIADSNDIATCDFTLSNPPFKPDTGIEDNPMTTDINEENLNWINAVDGRNNKAGDSERMNEFEVMNLEPSMLLSPKQGIPGDSINVQLQDFREGDQVIGIQFARSAFICGSDEADDLGDSPCPNYGVVTTNGSLSFSFDIPNSVSPGAQDLRIFTTNGKDNTTFAVGDGDLQLSATDVLPNQRISISGSGFTKSSDQFPAYIGNPDGERNSCVGTARGSVTLGGQTILWPRINDGEGIEVTSGGTWSAPVDLPINSSTTSAGTRELKIVDCRGGLATVDLTFAERTVTMTPAEGGVGTEVVISGNNFPVSNDDGSDIEVIVEYDAGGGETDDDDVEPDALGNFTVILEVPEDANIPSNNTVSVSFRDDVNAQVLDTFTHRVPQGTVAFSATRGGEGSSLTITANGFARYTRVDLVEFGDREITPTPNPSTDTSGNAEFSVRIPGSDPGIYIIRVEIDKVVATSTFTVVSGSGVSDGAVETVLGNVISEDALDRVFRFDNTTKMWEWYISDPAFASTNNLGGLSSGDLVYIKVTTDVTADILGASTTLTCTNAGTDTEDCWNLIAIP